jgi:hypothetical protein
LVLAVVASYIVPSEIRLFRSREPLSRIAAIPKRHSIIRSWHFLWALHGHTFFQR